MGTRRLFHHDSVVGGKRVVAKRGGESGTLAANKAARFRVPRAHKSRVCQFQEGSDVSFLGGDGYVESRRSVPFEPIGFPAHAAAINVVGKVALRDVLHLNKLDMGGELGF